MYGRMGRQARPVTAPNVMLKKITRISPRFLTAILAVSLLTITIHFLHPHLPLRPSPPSPTPATRAANTTTSTTNLRNATVERHARCIIYDKPPRTGSQTAVRALKDCVHSLGYQTANTTRRQSEGGRLIASTLSLPARTNPDVAILGEHFPIRPHEIDAFRLQCASIFYVTSTRAMLARMASHVKFEAARGLEGKNATRVLDAERQKVAGAMLRLMASRGGAESMMESYPFRGGAYYRPDYIIRSEWFDDDLGTLLRALGCRERYDSEHVHALEKNERGEVSFHVKDIKLRFNDSRHARLMKQVREGGNAVALRKVASFRRRTAWWPLWW